jgi:hypothetical protein
MHWHYQTFLQRPRVNYKAYQDMLTALSMTYSRGV